MTEIDRVSQRPHHLTIFLHGHLLTAILLPRKIGYLTCYCYQIIEECNERLAPSSASIPMKSLFILVVSAFLQGISATALPEQRPDYYDDTVQSSREGRTISKELFSSLEELSRIVDITYCVGTTGVYKPFTCAGRCHEFEGFELVTVCPTSDPGEISTFLSQSTLCRIFCYNIFCYHLTNIKVALLDLEHRPASLRFMRLRRPLPPTMAQTHHHRIPRHLLDCKHDRRSLRHPAGLRPLPGQ